jgi:CheY-like chemotaxis protein
MAGGKENQWPTILFRKTTSQGFPNRPGNISVTTAPSGRVAFEKLQHHSVDFIVLDILLPELDGFEVYSKLQADPDTKDIPVMIITAWADERHIEKASRVGIRHFLAKPFTEDELLREILSLLRDSSRTGP